MIPRQPLAAFLFGRVAPEARAHYKANGHQFGLVAVRTE